MRAIRFLIIVGLVSTVGMAVYAFQTIPDAPKTTTGLPEVKLTDPDLIGNQQTIIWTTIGGFLTLFLTQVAQAIQRERQRKWDVQDREAARKIAADQMAAQTAELKAKQESEAELVRARTAMIEAQIKLAAVETHGAIEHTRTELTRKVDENTELSRQAFTQANDVNAKLLRITQMIDSVQPSGRRSSDQQIRDIAKAVKDTQALIEDQTAPTLKRVAEGVEEIRDVVTSDAETSEGKS